MQFAPDLLALLRNARHIVALTGAGVSAESGIPTFRDALSGLWSKYDPAQLATPEAFERDPELVTRWYDERRCRTGQCAPNAGHLALAELQRHVAVSGRKLTLVTQNVDRLHQAAGSGDVIELHGTLWVWGCTGCGHETEERGPAFATYPPRCGECGEPKRPGVVWFGESLPANALLNAQRAAAACELFMSLGTSSVVHPAAALVDLSRRRGARVLEVNLTETPASDRCDWTIREKTGDVLPHLVHAVLV